MDLPRDYEAQLRRPPPSIMLALLAEGAEAPGPELIRRRLEAGGLEVTGLREPREPIAPSARWELIFDVRWPDAAPRPVSVWIEPAPSGLVEPLLDGGLGGRALDEQERREARAAQLAVGAALGFDVHPLLDYHRQLGLMQALAPGMALLVDTDALELRGPRWVREVARADVPPSPRALYSVHAVAGGPASSKEAPVWLHTHGLSRCGCIELDMVGISRRASSLCADLLHTVVALFLEWGVPPPDEPFFAGQDLSLLWLPWRDAMARVQAGLVGDEQDRGDDEHGGVRGVLFAPLQGLLRRRYLSPATYLPVLEDNPLLYVSSLETERMAMLARDRLARFVRLAERYGGEEGWRFLVKLGYPVRDAEDEHEREHLWFEVHAVDGAEVDATLLNAPYQVDELREGQRAHHRLELLTDWTILAPDGQYDAESIEALERRVGPARN